MIKLQHGILKNNANKFAAIYRLIDIVIIIASIFLATYFYQQSTQQHYLLLALVSALSFSIVAESLTLYRSWRIGTFKEMMFYTGLSWGIPIALIVVIIFFVNFSFSYSRNILGLWFAIVAISLIGWRAVFRAFLHAIRRRGYNTRSIAIFGLTEKGIALAREAINNPQNGYTLKAVYDDRSIERIDSDYHEVYKGNIASGFESARQNQYDVIYVALPFSAQERIKDILASFGDTTATVHVVPDFFMYCLMHGQMSHLGEVQTISVFDNPMSGGAALVKKIEDLIISIFVLIIFAIPMLIIAIFIKIQSPGKIFFKQARYGLNGRKINVWKFRTMMTDENDNDVKQATKNDPRVTKIGAFLRKTSLDELPQFFNVLKGDMSVIGPRPHAIAHNEEFRKLVDFYMLRHKVKPGITGLAQVNGWRGETDTIDKMKTRIEFDLDYIRNWSLWLDFKIIIFTIIRSFTDKNAY